MKFLDNAETAGGTLTTPKEITKFWTSVQRLRDEVQTSAVWLNSYRQRLMSVEQRVCEFLSQDCPIAFRRAIETRTMKPLAQYEPLERLPIMVHTIIQARTIINLKAKDYLHGSLLVGREDLSYTETVVRRIGRKDAVAVAADLATDILRGWMQQPATYLIQARANFVRIMVQYLGAGPLLLPFVYEAFDTLPHFLINTDSPKYRGGNTIHIDRSHHSQFEASVAASALASPTSHEYGYLDALKKEYLEIHAVMQERVVSLTKQTRTGRRKLPLPKRNPGLVPNFDLEHALNAGKPAEDLSRAEMTATTVSFLRETLKIVLDPEMKNPSKLQAVVRSNFDYYLPQRELAPSRVAFCKDWDPPEQDFTTSLFSIFIFRGVFFNSKFMQLSLRKPWLRLHFSSLNQFEEYISDMRTRFPHESQKEDFFCNRQALSRQNITHRTLEQSKQFWKAARKDKPWVDAGTDIPTFDEARKAVRTLGVGIGGFGTLCQYLTLADLAESGVIRQPTTTNIGEFIATINAGAISGLRLLRYLPRKDPAIPPKKKQPVSRIESKAAFQEFYRDISNELLTAEKKAMQWNPVMAEHTLCKISRLHSLGHIPSLVA